MMDPLQEVEDNLERMAFLNMLFLVWVWIAEMKQGGSEQGARTDRAYEQNMVCTAFTIMYMIMARIFKNKWLYA